MAEEEQKTKTEKIEETVDEYAEEIPEETDEEKEEIVKDIIENKEEIKEKEPETRFGGRRKEKTREEIIEEWKPKTVLGKKVKEGKIKNIDEILDKNIKILEPEIVDALINVKTDLISIGQSKGKFGGGKRRAWRQTQRKKKEGSVPTFSALAVVGDENGHVGIGVGKATETLPARDKATRKAKINIIKIIRGDGSFESVGGGNTSIPYKIRGRGGSVVLDLYPAAPGTGLVVADQLKKVLKLAGIKDIYSKSFGSKRTTFNFVKACMNALAKTNPKEKKK